MSVKTIIFPSDYFSPNMPDRELAEEYSAALGTGLFDAVIFDYEKWSGNEKLALRCVPEAPCRAVYRGWMMKPEEYKKFYEALAERNIILVTTPEKYEKFHIFPNIYPELEEDTARALFYPEGRVPVEEVKKIFPRFMIKDYVKSVKGTSFPKYFDASATQEEFDRQMEAFYKYRGELLTGGICVKEFLELKKYDGRTNEYRVFYAGDGILSVCGNSLQPEYSPAPPEKLIEKYRGLGSPFYTIDYAEKASGGWTIIEAGDGQVSGLSPGQEPSSFFRSLYYRLG